MRMAPVIKESRQRVLVNYEPYMQVKVLRDKDGHFSAPCFGPNKKPMSLDDLRPGAHGQVKMTLTKVWVINGRFGVTWTLDHINLVDNGDNDDRHLPKEKGVEAAERAVDYHSVPPSPDQPSAPDYAILFPAGQQLQ